MRFLIFCGIWHGKGYVRKGNNCGQKMPEKLFAHEILRTAENPKLVNRGTRGTRGRNAEQKTQKATKNDTANLR